MALSPGAKLGPYEIVAPLGAGGMGEVYRARDSRLERTVAIKVLPAQFSSDADLRQRLEREARAISALQHPNICTLHDIGHQEGVDYLVLEFVEGESLEQRLSKGPLPLEQVLRYAAEIAGALDKAHRHGIVHRDLKPGNIMLTRSGAKLLDFGLAKLQASPSILSSEFTELTAATQKLTAQGMLVGTFQYMAPEQLEGKEADARSDLFSLGAVIYEMAAGKPAFAGKSRASLIAAILSSEPPPISTLQPMTPPALDRVVKRCLAKDPDDRWQSTGDLASELKWIAEGGSHAGVPAPVVAHRKNRERLAWGVAAVLAILAVAAGLLYFENRGRPANSIQAYVPAPENTTYFFIGDSAGFPVISPQGDQLAFVAADDHGGRLLWIRSLSDGSARSLPGTDSATLPFWSPNGKSLGYFAGGKLKRVPVSGGSPTDIADVESARGGSWNQDDLIILTPSTQTGIYKVLASGGTLQPVTKVDTSRHTTHRWPYFLPDGKHFLYLAANHARPHADLDEIYVASLDGKENRRLTNATSNAIAGPGYLIFLQGTTLMAQPFDVDSATLKGEPIATAQNVHFEEGNWRGVFDCSPDGTLLYQAILGAQGSQLLWYDRDGRIRQKLSDDTDRFADLRLSPDAHRLVASIGDPSSNIFVYDLVRKVRTRYTFAGSTSRSPVWSPDGTQIAFARDRGGATDIFLIASDSAGTEKRLFTSPTLKRPTDWSPDGKYLLLTEAKLGLGVSLLPASGDTQAKQFLPQIINTNDARFSPDGRWVAYTSQESGRYEIFVTQFPGAQGKWQISSQGGTQAHWRRDGKAIFYWATDHTFMEAQVEAQGSHFQVNAVRPLFKAVMPLFPLASSSYDVTPDGQRFIVNTANSTGDQPLTVVTNWTARVSRK
jgi:eukaryotic-like serine/threonine-protein kinase